MMNERMTKAAVALAALAALIVFAASAVEAAETASHGLITGASVYVRSGGAKAYRALGKLTKGQFVDVITVSNDGKWVRIVAPEQADAWIFAKYVNVAGGKGVVTGDKVRVRSRPNLKGELVNRLDKGTVLKVKGREGDWLRIAPPKGTVAWIYAQYVKRMTAAEVAAYQRAQTDLARAEAEKKKREAELALKKKAEEARKKRESALIAEADKLFASELAKPITARSLDKALKAYQQVRAEAKDQRLRNTARVKLTLIQEMSRVQRAIARKEGPGPPSEFDFEMARKVYGVGREVDDLYAARKLATDIAARAKGGPGSPLGKPLALSGWVSYIGPGVERTGATHRIVKDGRVLALVKSARVDLGSFVGARVRVTGRAQGEVKPSRSGGNVGVIDVAGIEMVFN